ncbi:MAG: YbjN domain-containing protein [Nitrospinales bacterium]
MSHFEKVKGYLLEMGFAVEHEDLNEELVVVSDEERGISNLVLDCEDPILILEQVVIPLSNASGDVYKRLLQLNRELVHGAFVLDDLGTTLLFRDTLRLENLDPNELEGSIDALSLALAENGAELISFASKS